MVPLELENSKTTKHKRYRKTYIDTSRKKRQTQNVTDSTVIETAQAEECFGTSAIEYDSG